MGVKHGERYQTCPACGKRGVYPVNGYPCWGDGTKCCRYCHKMWKPGVPLRAQPGFTSEPIVKEGAA